MAWEIWEADCCSVLRALSFPVRLVNTSASEVSVLWSRDNGPFLLLAKQICREECYRWAEVLAFCLRRCSLCWSQCSICERFCPWIKHQCLVLFQWRQGGTLWLFSNALEKCCDAALWLAMHILHIQTRYHSSHGVCFTHWVLQSILP